MSDLLNIFLVSARINRTREQYRAQQVMQAANAGALVVDINPRKVLSEIAQDRLELCRLLLRADENDFQTILLLDDVFDASDKIKGGLDAANLSEEERSFLSAQRAIFEKNWESWECWRAFYVLSFYEQAYHLPLQTNIENLPDAVLARYLSFVTRQAHIMTHEDEGVYITYTTSLCDWLLSLIGNAGKPAHRAMIVRTIKTHLAFGTCYYLDCSIAPILKKRAALIAAMTDHPVYRDLGSFPANAPPATGRKKIRLGLLFRTLGDYTDTRSFFAHFENFDLDRYELYYYSLDKHGPIKVHDVKFLQKFYGMATKIVSLSGEGFAMARTVLEDDLDIFVIGTAFSFGVKDMDMMLSKRLARVQIGVNAMVPSASGFESYDYYIAPRPHAGSPDTGSPHAFTEEMREKPMIVDDPMIWYDRRPATKPDSKITRAALGIPEDAIVFCSGAAVNKLLPLTLKTYIEVLRRVPNSYLLFYPFNPAWGGYFIALIFFARLRAILAKDFPDISPERIVVVRQVVPEEGDRLILLSDVYLGSFPHGGATSAMLALLHKKPFVARCSPWLRGTTDESFLRSLDLDDWIAKDADDFVELAARLGKDKLLRDKITAYLETRLEKAAFFDVEGRSRYIQTLFDAMLQERGLLLSS